jgi:hypothetical protein
MFEPGRAVEGQPAPNTFLLYSQAMLSQTRQENPSLSNIQISRLMWKDVLMLFMASLIVLIYWARLFGPGREVEERAAAEG